MFPSLRTWCTATAMLVVALGTVSSVARAGDPKPAERVEGLIVPQGEDSLIKAKSKKRIATAGCKEECVRVRSVIGDPTTILITGAEPGLARLEVTDEDGKEEQVVLYVVPPKTLALGRVDTVILDKAQLVIFASVNKKKIKKAVAAEEKIAQFKIDAKDASKVEIRALGKGVTVATLTADDEKEEKLLIVVKE